VSLGEKRQRNAPIEALCANLAASLVSAVWAVVQPAIHSMRQVRSNPIFKARTFLPQGADEANRGCLSTPHSLALKA